MRAARERVRAGSTAVLLAVLLAVLAGLAAFAAPAPAAEAPPAPAPCFGSAACATGQPAVPAAVPAATPAAPGAVDPAGVPALDPRSPDLLSGIARDTAQAASTVLEDTFGWFLREESLPLEGRGVLAMQATMLGLAAIVLTLLVIVQGIRMMTTRQGAPFAELVRGLVVASLVIVTGIALIDSALVAGDRISDAVISLAFADSDALVQRMVEVTLGPGATGQAPVLLLVFSLLVLTAALLQAVLLLLRQCAIPVLGAVLPIAAVGQAGPPATQRWLPKLLNLVVALVLYKPVVALILCLGFVQFSAGTTLVDAIRGTVMIALSVAAFPVLLKLFAPVSYALAQRGGHGLAALGPMGLGSTFAARGAGTPGDTTAIQHAAYMSTRGPSSAAVVSADARSAQRAEPPSAAVVAFPRTTPGPALAPPAGPAAGEPGTPEGPAVARLRAADAAVAAPETVPGRSRHGSS